MMQQDEERIRERAYALSEQAGHPEGRDEEFWYAARLELMAEDQADELAAALPDVVVKKRA